LLSRSVVNPRVVSLLPLALAACASPTFHLIRLVDGPRPESSRAALEVVNVSTAVREPLAVRGSDVAYDDLDLALGDALAAAAREPRFAPFRISLEITDAKADFTDGRLSVRLTTRATLRARTDNAYVGQSQHVCSASDATDPGHGAPVVADCLAQLTRDLESWLTRSISTPPRTP
jgi:hypothetical protein